MAAASQLKASERQNICRKLVAVLKKQYKGPVPKTTRPALETVLFSACLEDASTDEAESRYERLYDEFHDLNEVRVSSISELCRVFDGLPEPEMRAMRIRSTLQFVFEKYFEFDFEAIRRKTVESAERQLDEIKGLSPFVRSYTLQATLGSHVIPVDQSMCNAAIWLGLVEPAATPQSASEQLKPALRKADAPLFCHLLRRLATDPKLKWAFDTALKHAPAEGYDAESSPDRLVQLFKNPAPPRKRSAAKKTPADGGKPAASAGRKKKSSAAAKTATRKKTSKKKSRASSR